MSWAAALPADELAEGTPTAADVEGRALCLVRVAGELHAFDDACPHRQWPLHEGKLVGRVLTCRAHTWEWDVTDGTLQRMRAPECLTMHPVRERDGVVEVDLADDLAPAAERSRLWARARARAREAAPS